jgi:hypothetical protein
MVGTLELYILISVIYELSACEVSANVAWLGVKVSQKVATFWENIYPLVLA